MAADPPERHLKWHICIRKGKISMRKIEMKVNPFGLVLIPTFLKIEIGTFLKNEFTSPLPIPSRTLSQN